jgi:S-adenosyl methyltransferase
VARTDEKEDRWMTDYGLRADLIDTSKPQPARMYDYYLGGKDNYEADREAARSVEKIFPGIKICARVNRDFMHRATRHLAQAGIRQFLDIGTGIPTEPNLHQVAQRVASDARVVYVDNDPIVLIHAHALLTSAPEGRTAYIEADVRDPDAIIGAPQLHSALDLSEPVALSLNALMHFVPDENAPYDIVKKLVGVLPKGSALVFTHVTTDFAPKEWEQITDVYRSRGTPLQVRAKAEIERFFDGLDLMEPGVVLPHRWKPERESTYTDAEVSLYAGVAFKR